MVKLFKVLKMQDRVHQGLFLADFTEFAASLITDGWFSVCVILRNYHGS